MDEALKAAELEVVTLDWDGLAAGTSIFTTIFLTEVRDTESRLRCPHITDQEALSSSAGEPLPRWELFGREPLGRGLQTCGFGGGKLVQPPKGTGINKSCSDAPRSPKRCLTVGSVKYTYGIGEFEITSASTSRS